MKDRWYVAIDEMGKLIVFGWNLRHEPTSDNESGYDPAAGPFATEQEAREYAAEN